jgi:hypothetical protein
MKSPQVVRARLETRSEADCSKYEVKDNKIHYHLKFEQEIGWDWLTEQVRKTQEDEEIELELWKINTSGVCAFEVEVRELVRREGVNDDDQHALKDFE